MNEMQYTELKYVNKNDVTIFVEQDKMVQKSILVWTNSGLGTLLMHSLSWTLLLKCIFIMWEA